MEKIDIQYIKQSKNIIDTHNNLMIQLEYFQTVLDKNKQILLSKQSEIYDIQHSEISDIAKQTKLSELLDIYESEISKLHEIIEPYIKQMDDLKKNSEILYKTIKEKYPGIPDNELQKQIFTQINELTNEKNPH